MKALVILLIVSLCCTLVPAAEGLTCYKTSWKDNINGVLEVNDNTPTEECGGGTGNSTDKTPVGGTTIINPAGASVPGDVKPTTVRAFFAKYHSGDVRRIPSIKKFTELSDTSYYCFAALINNDQNTTVVQRGCKEDAKTDNCLSPEESKTLGTKFLSCSVCEEDKCNNGVSITWSVQCALVSAAVFAKLFF